MRILGIDLETTGLDPKTDSIIEVGLVYWDAESNQIERANSFLVRPDIEIPETISQLTGITNEMVLRSGKKIDQALGVIERYFENASYVVAHNAAFERSFLESTDHHRLMSAFWIDTMTDLPYRDGKGKGTLNDICMSHGIFNTRPHRALPDTIAMMQLLSLYDFREVQRYAMAGTETLILPFAFDATGGNQAKAKALGYRWNSESKQWQKEVKDFKIKEEQEAASLQGFTAQLQRQALPF